jgi:hypothetical protein
MTVRMRMLSTHVAKKSTSNRFLLLVSVILPAKSFLGIFLGLNTVIADFIAHFGCRIRVVFLARLEREWNATCGRRRRNNPSSDTTEHVHFQATKWSASKW